MIVGVLCSHSVHCKKAFHAQRHIRTSPGTINKHWSYTSNINIGRFVTFVRKAQVVTINLLALVIPNRKNVLPKTNIDHKNSKT